MKRTWAVITIKNNLKSYPGLPKWPQCIITGKPVAPEQAQEIIRRTDQFFGAGGGGNARQQNRKIRQILGMPEDPWDTPQGTERGVIRELYQRIDAWKKSWGYIETDYIHNTWIASAYVGGPYGWCHPDGQIGYIDNIGKWPSVEEVCQDLSTLLEAFPYLELGVTLLDGEICEDDEKQALVSLRIGNGCVELFDPEDVDVHEGHPEATRTGSSVENPVEVFARQMALPPAEREFGIPWAWIEEWGAQFQQKLPHELAR